MPDSRSVAAKRVLISPMAFVSSVRLLYCWYSNVGRFVGANSALGDRSPRDVGSSAWSRSADWPLGRAISAADVQAHAWPSNRSYVAARQ